MIRPATSIFAKRTQDFSPEEIDVLLQNIDELSDEEAQQLLEITEVLEERERAQRCRDDLIEFCKAMQPDYLVGAHHKHLAKLLTGIEAGEKDRVTVSIAPRHGKQLAHDTPVLTPNGYVNHGDLRPGDYVFGLDGKPAKVLAISEELEQDMEVEFSNGEIIKCHAHHEWSVYSNRRLHSSRPLETHETKRLAEDVWIGTKGARGGRSVWQLPDADPVQFRKAAQPLHPYALGVWLGDGSTTKPHITGVDEEIFNRFVEVTGFHETMRVVHKDTGVTTVAYAGPRSGVRGQLSACLQELGLTKTKFIPNCYKIASFEQRLQLLAGLIDTDGHVEEKTGRCRVVTVSEVLAKDIHEVATSLGFRPYITAQEPVLSSSGILGKKRVYTVGFQPTCALPTVLKRKQVTNFSMRRKISIVDIRKTEPVMGRCIQVDRKDGLYLVGRSNIPTHNSQLTSIFFAAWFLGKNPTKQVMLVSHTTDLAVDFGRKVRNLIDSPAYQAVFPGVSLAADSKSAGRWNTNQGGVFYATGVGSSLAGRGADLLLCLAGDTVVNTTEGKKLLKNINIGDKVLGLAGYNKVTKKMMTTHSVWYKINGQVKCSGEHRFLTKRGWVQAKDLRPTDKIITVSIWRQLWLLIKTFLRKFLPARLGRA